jgi:hypothetical protein
MGTLVFVAIARAVSALAWHAWAILRADSNELWLAAILMVSSARR